MQLAELVRKLGFDYFTVKPFSQHPQSKAKLSVDYSEAEEIGLELKAYETDNFRIYFRSRSIENLGVEKPYEKCGGMHFMTYMDSASDVFTCIVSNQREEFIYRNINKQDLSVI